MHWIRRLHLYLGLFLFPWAVLYGVTGFLFNHPAAFSDQHVKAYSSQDWVGTPLENPPAPSALAQEIVDALNRRMPGENFALINPDQATFVREMATATVKAGGRQFNVALDLLGRGCVIRSTAIVGQPTVERPPFAVGALPANGQHGAGHLEREEKLILESPLPDRIKQSIPALLARLGYPTGDVSVGNVPELTFQIQASGKTWTANYNPTTGSVSGRPVDTAREPLTARRFLTRLHLAHGYTYSFGPRWVWAVIVDLMAFVMLFWGGSGLLMWWQIKMTRHWGMMTMAASFVTAVLLTLGMWRVLSM